jgi:hypothetical protein
VIKPIDLLDIKKIFGYYILMKCEWALVKTLEIYIGQGIAYGSW